MAENIELHSLRKTGAKESDIEEYHEINLDDFADQTTTDAHTLNVNEYDFFTKHNVNPRKSSTKKKKSKKKEKSSTLMDIITSELASIAVPIKENVITMEESTVEQRNSYLETTPRAHNFFRRAPNFDYEQGWGHKQDVVKLQPSFPSVFENITTGDADIQVQYVKPLSFNDLVTEFRNEEQQETWFLDIEIKDIKFKHHHNFSLEKLLSVKLNEYYKEYTEINISLQDIAKEMKINRETRDKLKQEILKISPNKKDDIRFDQTVRKYTKALLELKEKYSKTLQMQKEILHKITVLYADIEMVREKSGHTDTAEVLTIIKTTLDDNEYEKEWNEMFNLECQDMLDKIEYEFVNKYIEYKEVKYTQNLDDSAKRRISKPKLQIDEEVLKEEVQEIVNTLVVKDNIDIDLKHDKNILSDPNKPEKSKYINFDIYVDDVLVCESEHFVSKNDQQPNIDFTEALSVQILPNNSTLYIMLLENDIEASSLSINLADIKKSTPEAEFVRQRFKYNVIIEPSINHVGSGHSIKEIASQNKVRLKSSNIFKGNLYTACEVSIKMGWSEKATQDLVETVKSSMNVGRQIKRLIHGIDKPTTDVLGDIISKLYNKDIRNNENVLDALRRLSKKEVADNDTFPIDENSPEYVRLKLLHLRNSGGMANVENKTIPIHASQISTEHLNCLQKNKDTNIDVLYFNDKYANMDPIEIQRFIGAKYLQKLNANMLKNLNEHLLRKTHKDVVRDFKDLSFRSLFTNHSNLNLANISSSAKQQLLTEALGREQEIRITVLRAFNLPDRNNFEAEEEDEIAGFKLRSLRPFVRVSYNGVAAQTVIAIGRHPSWSQTLKINAKPNPLSAIQVNIFDEHKSHLPDSSDSESGRTVHYRYCNRWLGALQIPLHTVLTLGNLRGTFRITVPPILFGYENSHTKDSSQSLSPAVNQLMKKDISFVSLQITTGLSHLGGLHGYNQPIPNSEDDYLINHLNNFVTEYVNDFPHRNISLTFIDSSGRNKCVTQFLQPIPLPDHECFPKNPKLSESALSKSSGLSKSSSSKSSGKKRGEERVSYSGEERESLYSSMSWKNGDNQLDKLMTTCARYVSLIPTYEITESHTVTLLGLELLKVLHGSPLDHTILLASYFLYLGIRCWVAIGLGLPRGHSSYVITKYDLAAQRAVLLNDQIKSRSFLSRGEGCIWYVHDAVSGERSELRDVSCPLKTVDFVFDNDNIWVNVQSTLDCESVSFDFTRSSDWKPVINKTIFVMKLPVVSEPNLYRQAAITEPLRLQLENRIRDKVQKWRTHMKTIWNRYCSSLLKEMLPHWEYWAFNPSEPKPGLSQRLKQLMVTYKMFGFPLNTPYVNTKSVISSVKSTGVHLTADPNVEFGLAVEVYAYPNNVLSVWVFLANITRL